ncbi:MAG: hypothetical protein UR85_C0003G0037 [Candidatus Nomurabacteria bacterium GW2011_GWF2_35_66]|uniref:Uncharacterized protein n=1 Tax=Candidatus Nomurabacteria bacterium GW2011_GWE1_35_16 TaxID=1618761 RepID=A0A0G0BSE6_9BACT|nr:MAG: hypothetical protein UR55_C0005G0036 [Candidatus Nomurabacteria bacterium GW2011_GWF1_34_20]KKP63364.1 MAG: hypothetical protein UR57_C0005G0036 [Candidatus Nomurabacteria bacterium GW2011_GWE2_34_25]KKP66556.1 MAG: hypothetical protein UR64_C0005G0018 [Candidatus Nomurabacteria bacterium GW2011_GWE1_35_16]KKP83602.1 MAG: hypothetical protein UR85_C0003G0037 [Candidatus Nomurabacteria bacterium GW2011_GWF2_35_66]
MIDKKSKIFLGVLSFLAMISIVAVYYKYVIIKDFNIIIDEAEFNQSLSEE